MKRATSGWAIGGETVRALLVLALLFLNFGHVAPSFGSAPAYLAGDSFCGDPIAPGEASHAPCHACRIGAGADLPPKPGCVEPVVFLAVDVMHGAPILVLPPSPGVSLAQPRGPPALV